MITSLQLINFKGFKSLNISLRSMTLLAGLNGMGKSSILQSLLLLRQSYLSRDLEAGRLLIGGELVDLGTGVDLLFEGADADRITIGFTSETAGHFKKTWQAQFAYDRTADKLTAVDSQGKPDKMQGTNLVRGPPFMGNISYVHAERWGPRKTLPLSDSRVLAFDLGSKGEYVLHILLEHGSEPLEEHDVRLIPNVGPKLIDQVNGWMQEISPGSHLSIEQVRTADLAIAGFSFDREGDVSSRVFRATNVGFGLSYVLPVIVSLLGTRPGGLILLENPEAHLHPRGQTRMGQLAARAAAAGVQVIAETHSDHFMNGVRIEVKGQRLKPEDTAFHYFNRSESNIEVVSPKLDSEGKLSKWPEGFFDQHDENLIQLLAPRE